MYGMYARVQSIFGFIRRHPSGAFFIFSFIFFAADRLVLNHARSGVPVESGSPTGPMKHETGRLKEAESDREVLVNEKKRRI